MTKHQNIAWIHKPNITAVQKSMILRHLRAIKFPVNKIVFIPSSKLHEARPLIQARNCGVAIINDKQALDWTVNDSSLAKYRGSVLHEAITNLPAVVMDDVLVIAHKPEGVFAFHSDANKALRILERGIPDNDAIIHIAKTVDDVRTGLNELAKAPFVAVDIETLGSPPFMTCIGISSDKLALVIPFFNPTEPLTRCWWVKETDEIEVWKLLQQFMLSSQAKCFHNFSFDTANMLRYNLPVHNCILDTQHLWHSCYAELKKSLAFVSSILLDNYCYWKDEIKGDAEKSERIPSSVDGFNTYLMYNGKDCINTWHCCSKLLQTMQPWQWQNYKLEWRQQLCYIDMDVRGMLVDKKLHSTVMNKLMDDYESELATLRIMVADPEFNPNSPQQVASLLYDVLGAKALRGKGRSTDEKVLKVIRFQHPLISRIIDQIWKTKKPRNNVSKYGGLNFLNDRFYAGQNASGTETGRSGGGKGAFFLGTNPLNFPKKLCNIFISDPQYVMFDADFGQSDAWFVAYESECPEYIKLMNADGDSHSMNAAFFFNRDYDELIKYKNEPWVSGDTGVRTIGKKIVHGRNYQMQSFTLYQTMGIPACEEAAKVLNMPYETEKDLVRVCDVLLNKSLKAVPGLAKWFRRLPQEVKRNYNLISCFGGMTRKIMGNPLEASVRRELYSFKGQGGTAGNMRRTLDSIMFKSDLRSRGLNILREVYDSVIGQVRLDKIDLLNEMLTYMEQPCIVNGRTFVVPAEANIGWRWGKQMFEYRRGMTPAEVVQLIGERK